MKQSLLLVLFLHSIAFSQIVNIENKRISETKEGFSGGADLNLSFTMNSKQLLQIGDKFSLGYKKGKNYWMLITDHAFVKSTDESFINKGYEHVRYNYHIKDSGKVVLEAYQQGQFNKIQRINLRLLLGSGFRFNIVHSKNYHFSIGTGIMGEYEELTELENTMDLLSSNYVSFDGQFSESIGMNSITYFQPKITDIGIYRLSNETSIRLRVNKYLTVKVVYSLNHDSRSIEDVRKTNYVLKNTLSFTF